MEADIENDSSQWINLYMMISPSLAVVISRQCSLKLETFTKDLSARDGVDF